MQLLPTPGNKMKDTGITDDNVLKEVAVGAHDYGIRD